VIGVTGEGGAENNPCERPLQQLKEGLFTVLRSRAQLGEEGGLVSRDGKCNLNYLQNINSRSFGASSSFPNSKRSG